jgi:hypothetical protein
MARLAALAAAGILALAAPQARAEPAKPEVPVDAEPAQDVAPAQHAEPAKPEVPAIPIDRLLTPPSDVTAGPPLNPPQAPPTSPRKPIEDKEVSVGVPGGKPIQIRGGVGVQERDRSDDEPRAQTEPIIGIKINR